MKLHPHAWSQKHVLIGICVVVVLGALGYGGYRGVLFVQATKQTEDTLVISTQKLEDRLNSLETVLSDVQNKNLSLKEALLAEQQRRGSVEEQIKGITNTVGTLEKLTRTDKELLQKYSRVYFLNENYTPTNLVNIYPQYLHNEDKALQIRAEVLARLTQLFEASTKDGVTIQIISAYRSFGAQSVLKSSYTVTYGAGSNQFSADQGYSEHQLGTTIDFTTPITGASFSKFEGTTAYQWLIQNAYKYGFILSYPKQNTYYQFEPWHWRFVGLSLATKLHQDGKYFYDLDQREIDQYLAGIFD